MISEYVIDSDARLHAAKYKQNIGMCRKVLIVSHSQGNFYANQAWRLIYGSQTEGIAHNRLKLLGIFSVATPANQVGFNLAWQGDREQITGYRTLSNDWVINAVRVFSPITLSSNMTNSNNSSDWKNHSFIDSYISGNRSGPAIVRGIKAIAYDLETLRFDKDSVNSSAIASIGYDPTASLLEIEFKESGSVYRYYGVSQPVYKNMMSASSIGRYYNQVIRGRYPVKRLL